MGEEFLKSEYKSVIWTLIDSDQSRGIPEDLVDHNMPFFVIFATYPAKERWSRLHKSYNEKIIVMNPWTRSEIHKA
jgi:hypothetical protein